MAGKSKDDGPTVLGFLAVSKTASARMATFPISPGFDQKGPAADLRALLAKDKSWQGFAVSIDNKGKLRLRGVNSKS